MSIQLFSQSASTLNHRRFLVISAVGLLCCFAPVATAQRVNVAIRGFPGAPGRVLIEGNCTPTRTWSFRNDYAGVSELAGRIAELKLSDAAGVDIPVRKIAPGQFEATTAAARFRYEVVLAPPLRASDAARVSWLNAERGLLMLADLLPVLHVARSDDRNRRLGAQRVTLRLKLPDSWATYSNEAESPQGEFDVDDADQAVFAVGAHLRSLRATISGMTFGMVTDGEWTFADRDALEMASKVLKAHSDVFGGMPAKQATLILFPLSQTVGASQWSAETRGSTVTLLIGKLPSKNAALAQLSVPLTHELFHFWVPNALALDGDYDWFYEGFTIYQAARTAVRLGLLTFAEFLNAIVRAYDNYAGSADRDRWSLVEASKRRWTGGESSVYSKSMVVAFLYDLRLRSQSRGKRSLDDTYRKIFREHRLTNVSPNTATGPESDGNDVATNALTGDSTTREFVRAFIRSPVTIDLQGELAPFGLRVEKFALRTRIVVSDQLSKGQRDLLREFGLQ